MKRVMLVVEDYRELKFLSGLLQKLGFDTMSFSKDAAVGSSTLSFVPELIITNARGRSVDGSKLLTRIRKHAPVAKVLFLYGSSQSSDFSPELKKMANAFLETPVEPAQLIPVLAQMMKKADADILLEKYRKISGTKLLGDRGASRVITEGASRVSTEGASRVAMEGASRVITEGASRVAGPKSERHKKYEQFLQTHDEPADKTLSLEAMSREAEVTKPDPVLQEQKKEFVRALFRRS